MTVMGREKEEEEEERRGEREYWTNSSNQSSENEEEYVFVLLLTSGNTLALHTLQVDRSPEEMEAPGLIVGLFCIIDY